MTLHISDHALLRYAERRYGVDFEKLRQELSTPIVQAAAKAGCHAVKCNGGKVLIKNQCVVTYIIGTGGRD